MRFHHVAKHSEDIGQSVDWYRQNLGAKVLKQDEDWALILIQDVTLALTKPDIHPEHIAFEVDDIECFPCDADDIKIHRDGSMYYYQEAPDGSVIEWLYWPK
ncbi:MAG TPA: hypothetical protein DF712_17830 [Balneola sp.]|nr:hypothetical protein [Balneola sp.]